MAVKIDAKDVKAQVSLHNIWGDDQKNEKIKETSTKPLQIG